MSRDPNKRQIGAYISKDTKAALQKEADANHRSLSNQLEVTLIDWLEDQRKRRADEEKATAAEATND